MKEASGHFLLAFCYFGIDLYGSKSVPTLDGGWRKDATRMRSVGGGCATDETPKLSSKQDYKGQSE